MAESAPGALDGLKVLDLTRILAGPLCTMTLGDMGAEVIKIEPPGGDDTRGWGPPYAGGEAAYFLGVNRNKRSMVLNLADNEARAVLGALIRRSDVLVENYKLGTLDKWGFGAKWRAAEAPRLVHCAITGYGTSGPKAALPGYDFILQAESGLMSITGEETGEPVKYGVAIVDLATGMLATIAILGALAARRTTGRGQTVEVSLFETSLALLANVAQNHLVSNRPTQRYGNGHPNIVPYRSFATADGKLALAVGNDAQFARLAALLDHPEWAEDARFAANAGRVLHRAEVDRLVAGALKQRSTQHWLAALRDIGIPAGAINDVAQALADPQTAAREMVLTSEHPTAGHLRLLGFPFDMSLTPPRLHRPPPRLGEHTRSILREELGLDTAQIAALYARGACPSGD